MIPQEHFNIADLSWFVFAGNMRDLFWRNLLVTGALITTKKAGNYEDTVKILFELCKLKMLKAYGWLFYDVGFQADTCV
jgi:hypothetical protein